MIAVAKLRNCHMSARKMRLVADLVRGMPISDALNTLKYSKKEASVWIEKCLLSAIANWEYKAEDRFGDGAADEYDLRVSTIRVDEGGFIKRLRPAPHGRAHRIRKRSCHIIIEVDNFTLLDGEGVEVEHEELQEAND